MKTEINTGFHSIILALPVSTEREHCSLCCGVPVCSSRSQDMGVLQEGEEGGTGMGIVYETNRPYR